MKTAAAVFLGRRREALSSKPDADADASSRMVFGTFLLLGKSD